MKYYKVNIGIHPINEDARDVFAAMAGDVGFESFEETENGLTGYIQQDLFNEQALKEMIEEFPFEGTTIEYDVSEAEDKDWNEQWEKEGFEPISVDNKLIIHDGRHLPSTGCLSIEIDARMAFGTGTHETTRMVCSTLLSLFAESSYDNVLDCGTGTGILAICALKLGASKAIGYDIDEWSVDNARHNAVINHVDDRFTSVLGDVNVLKSIEGEFEIVLANINRNILLADMPVIRKMMAQGGKLVLSGFYKEDIPLLKEKAESLGLKLENQKEENGWACIMLSD